MAQTQRQTRAHVDTQADVERPQTPLLYFNNSSASANYNYNCNDNSWRKSSARAADLEK